MPPLGSHEIPRNSKNINPANGTSAPACAQIKFQTNQPPRILVVDPDPYLRHLSAEVLIRQGYIVNAVEDGAAGWGELQANNYDLLISGYALPGTPGVKLIRKLRAARLALAVVLVADKLSTQKIFPTPSLDIAATLWKPLPFDVLLDTVNIVLGVADHLHEQFALWLKADKLESY